MISFPYVIEESDTIYTYIESEFWTFLIKLSENEDGLSTEYVTPEQFQVHLKIDLLKVLEGLDEKDV